MAQFFSIFSVFIIHSHFFLAILRLSARKALLAWVRMHTSLGQPHWDFVHSSEELGVWVFNVYTGFSFSFSLIWAGLLLSYLAILWVRAMIPWVDGWAWA